MAGVRSIAYTVYRMHEHAVSSLLALVGLSYHTSGDLKSHN